MGKLYKKPNPKVYEDDRPVVLMLQKRPEKEAKKTSLVRRKETVNAIRYYLNDSDRFFFLLMAMRLNPILTKIGKALKLHVFLKKGYGGTNH